MFKNGLNNKNFFANLAGADNEKEDDVFQAELVSAKSSSDKKDKKNEVKNEGDIVEIDKVDDDFEEDDVEGQLTIDVYQDDKHIYIESPVAGVSSEDLDISITPESVSIKGKRGKRNRTEGRDYLYQECFWGSFSRSVILPQEIDPDRANASLKNGVLKITLPKVNRSKSRSIKVKLE